jgi:hypothetical protein
MDGSQITWSKDNALNSYNVFEEDGTTPAIGTDYNGITKITVDFDGAKCSIVSLDKIVEDIEARVTDNETDISNINVVLKETLAMPVGPFWDVKYEADVLPENADPAWNPATNTGTANLVAGGLQLITTTGEVQYYTRETGLVVPANIKRVEVDVTVNSNGAAVLFKSQLVRIGDGVRDLHTMFTTTGIDIIDDTVTAFNVFTGDMTIKRTVKIEVDNVNGALFYVDGVLEHTQPYVNIWAAATNTIAFGDYAGSGENFTSDILWGKVFYNVDVATNPGGTDWIVDGDFFSQEVTITGLLTALDTWEFKPKPLTLVQKEAWDFANFVRIDRVDDTTIKIVAVNENDQAFDFDFDIIKTDAGIT